MSARKLDSTEKIDSTTQTDINHWNLDLSKEQPEPYHYGGKANAGKILKVSNDGFIRLGTGGGGGTTYTGTNGITVDNTNHTIGLDTAGATTPELANLKVTGDFVLDKGADFNASTGAELNVYCEATFENTVNMVNAEVTLPNVILTVRTGETIKGDVTTNEWTLLSKNESGYVKWGTDKFYYVGRKYDTTDPTLLNKLTYVCPNKGKIEISRIDGVSPAPDTYEWVYSAVGGSLYQHTLVFTINDTVTNYTVSIALFLDTATKITQLTLLQTLKDYVGFETSNYLSIIPIGSITASDSISEIYYSLNIREIYSENDGTNTVYGMLLSGVKIDRTGGLGAIDVTLVTNKNIDLGTATLTFVQDNVKPIN